MTSVGALGMLSDFNLLPLLPEIFLAITAMGLLIVGVVRGNEASGVVTCFAIGAIAIALVIGLGISRDHETVMNGMFVFDGFAAFMKFLIALGLMASLALSIQYLQAAGSARFEYPILVMFAGIGMMVMVSSHHMLSLYMGLELQSLSLYVLASFHRNTVKSSEAGIKYFILGALSSGLLLFGISLVYGFTGALDFNIIAEVMRGFTPGNIPTGVVFGIVFILAGLSFKISAVPFHMWTPDVYEGAPTSVTALFAIVPKLAAMGLLLRLLFEPFALAQEQWLQIIYVLSLASLAVGAFAAIAQTSLKRLMAYSSIGHMGYALIGIVAGGAPGVGAVMLYLMIYMVMSAGAFAVIIALRRSGRAIDRIEDLAGLSQTSPVLAYAMAMLMFSMAGIPPLAGFFGKLVIFQAAVTEGYMVLAVLGLLASVVAAYYYLRIIKVMFFEEAADAVEHNYPFSIRAVLAISLLFVCGFVLKPSVFMAGSHDAATSLFSSSTDVIPQGMEKPQEPLDEVISNLAEQE